VSDGHSLPEASPQLYTIDQSTMIPPMAKAAPTQSPKRSERPKPQAFFRKNSPALPLRAVHFSDRLAFGPVRSEFFVQSLHSRLTSRRSNRHFSP
jgi:hypothetical protein